MTKEATYSVIISPEDYNKINTDQHLYIKGADLIIVKFIQEIRAKLGRDLEVVEIGCGPARISESIAKIKGVNLTAIDHDQIFIEFAKQKIKKKNVHFLMEDFEKYKHPKTVDVFVSQGVHHHIAKPPKYLLNVKKQLSENGVFILSDEFLPNYISEEERREKAVIWYSHIISHANQHHFKFLAQEEAKTLLDELNTHIDESRIKTKEQIDLVLNCVDEINTAAKKGDLTKAKKLAHKFLKEVSKIYNYNLSGDSALDLSRGDYKICDKIFGKEIENVGFFVEKSKAVGPIDTIGALVVYILKKK